MGGGNGPLVGFRRVFGVLALLLTLGLTACATEEPSSEEIGRASCRERV
jgi:hypothetical protein